MTVLKSLALAFSCFSRVPVPRVEWNPANMRYMMACFPLVGVAVGALVALWCWACAAAGFGDVLRAAGIVLVPIAVTGGIHLDGLADVVDAQSSHAPAGRKRAILKDPHIGAFAVIGVASYLVAYLGLAAEVPHSWRAVALLALVPVVVRCESGFATVLFAGPLDDAGDGRAGGMLAAFRSSADRGCAVALVGEYALAAAAMAVCAPLPAGVMLACGLACLAALNPFARRAFGGMSGDVAGFFLQACEIAMIACLVVTAKAVGL